MAQLGLRIPQALSASSTKLISSRAGPHKFARVLKVCLDTKLSGMASTAASAKAQSASLSPDQSPSSVHSPSLIPKATRSGMTESVHAPTPRPTLHEPRPDHVIPLADVSRRLVGEQGTSDMSAEAISSSPVTTSVSPIHSPARNKVLLVEDNAVNLKVCSA